MRRSASDQAALNNKLQENLKGREYVAFYRGFERWQQAFQSRKMEEHLCAQNLQYYQHRQRLVILYQWKQNAALKILSRYQSLKLKQRLISAWRASTSVVSSSRTKRLLSRTITRWRHAYRQSVAKQLVDGTNRKIIRLILVSWRVRCQKQRDSHQKSVEFIGSSSMRYFLQKWRTEATINRFKQNQKGLAASAVPRYYQISAGRQRQSLSAEQVFYDPAPINDSEFVV
jgi:hypothetical protein